MNADNRRSVELDGCHTCRHSTPVMSDIEAEGPLLQCRRYPPQLFVLDGEVTQAWPGMNEGDWCSEWRVET